MRMLGGALIAALMALFAGPAAASSETQWLQSRHQADGSYTALNDIATSFQGSAEALSALRAWGELSSTPTESLAFLGGDSNPQGTEYLARRLIAVAEAGLPVDGLVNELVTNHRNPDGGFGEFKDYESSALDTAFALLALHASNASGASVSGAVQYLTSIQQADGSWVDKAGGGDLSLTALCLSALGSFSGAFSISAALEGGANFLLSRRQADGLWGEDFLSASAIEALITVLTDLSVLQPAIESLGERRRPDGSWGPAPEGGDVFSTALALKALIHAQQRGNGVTEPTNGTGTIQGFVTFSDGQPAAGATVTVPSLPGYSATTAANGFFAISGLAPGDETLVASKFGSADIATTVTVVSNQIRTASGLVLHATGSPAAPSTVTLKGTLVDGLTNVPVSGATVTVIGGSSAVTTSQGLFTISGIATLQFSVRVDASGYNSQTFSVTAPAFGTVSQAFYLAPLPQGGQTIDLFGTIKNSSTQAAIPNATLQVSGTSRTATTDGSGQFELNDLPSLKFDLTISATGYMPKTLHVSLSGPGRYGFSTTLSPASTPSGNGFQVLSLVANDVGLGPDQRQRFDAQILGTTQEAVVVGHILNSAGVEVATMAPYLPEKQIRQTHHRFRSGMPETLQMEWDTAQAPPGIYTVTVTVSSIDSFLGNPKGAIYTERSTFTRVSPAAVIGGGLEFDPPVAQGSSSLPVQLQVLLRNAGNIDLSGQSLTLLMKRRIDGEIVHRSSAVVAQLAPLDSINLQFGTWLPPKSGSYDVVVSGEDGVQGAIVGSYAVADASQATFELAPSQVPSGTQTVRANVHAAGIAAEIGVDKALLEALRHAVDDGSDFLAGSVMAWPSFPECLACHVQSQSHYGLGSLTNRNIAPRKAEADFLSNAIVTALQDSGWINYSSTDDSGIQTKTLENVWSLTQSANRSAALRAQYKALSYLVDPVLDAYFVEANGKAHWRVDYTDGGWWSSEAGLAMFAMSSLVDILEASQDGTLGQLTDYALSTEEHIGVSDSLGAAKAASDGNVYVCSSKFGHASLYRVEVSANVWPAPQQRVAGADTASTSLPESQACISLAVVSPTKFYAVFPGASGVSSKPLRLIDTVAHTAVQVASIASTVGVRDMAVGSDGTLYLVDRTAGAILARAPTGGNFTTYISGLYRPVGLVATPDGFLYVANSGDHTILKFAPDRSFTVVAKGLGDEPYWLAIDDDGTLYATQERGIGAAHHDEPSVVRVRPDGSAERLVTTQFTNGIAVAGHKAYLARWNTLGTESGLRQIQTSVLSTQTQVDRYKAVLEEVVREALADIADDTTNNLTRAERLVALGEARRVITDPAFRDQIAAGMTTLVQALRGAQKSDGGWSQVQGAACTTQTPVACLSDALVTSVVGMGLDEMGPAPNDPTVVGAIKFLLNEQQANHSWVSANKLMSTNLAVSSLVMSYLPHALERLGGTKPSLSITLPTGALSNATPQITRAVPSASGTTYVWEFGEAGETAVAFDLTFPNLGANESRPAAQEAYLGVTNSFTGEQVRVDIQIPAVHAVDGVALVSAQTDKLVYGANETAQLSATVTNIGLSQASGSVVFTIISTSDGLVVAELPAVEVADLGSGFTQPVYAAWPTGLIRAGAYSLKASLISNALVVDEKTAAFSVIADGATTALRTTTDRQTYNTTDTVRIESLAQDLAANQSIPDAVVHISVTAPGGQTLLSQDISLGELAPGAVVSRSLTQVLSGAVQGSYTVSGTLRDGASNMLASASATYQVVEDLSRTIIGSVSAQYPTRVQGEPQSCTDTLTNRGTLAASNLPIRRTVARLDQDATLISVEETVSLVAGETRNLLRAVATGAMEGGDYACALEFQVAGQWKSAGHATFRVTPETLALSAAAATNQPIYDTTDQATITLSAHSNMAYRTAKGTSFHLEIAAPDASVVLTRDLPVPDVAPGQTVGVPTDYAFSNAVEGDYAVHVVLRSAEGATLAIADTQYEVRKAFAISGAVVVQSATVSQGLENVCTDTINNVSIHPIAGLEIRQSLIRTDEPATIGSTTSNVDVPANGSVSRTRTIPTTTFDGGTYKCVLEYNREGWQPLGEASFSVTAEPVTATSAVSANKSLYDVTDHALLTLTAHSAMQYRTLKGAVHHVEINAPDNAIVFSSDVNLADLAPGQSIDSLVDYDFTDVAEGTYTVHAQLKDQVGEGLASSQTTYQVKKSLARALTGTVAVQQATVHKRDAQSCTDTLTNSSTNAISGLQVRQILQRTDVTPVQTITTTDSVQDVPASGNKALIRTINTNSMEVGSYACALQAFVDNEWKDLDQAFFSVVPPWVQLSSGFTIGPRGRLLVLMDDQATRTGGSLLCDNGTVGMQLEAVFDPPLTPAAVVNVSLLRNGLLLDLESTKIGAFDGEIDARLGSQHVNLQIPYVSADNLLITLTGENSEQLLADNYSILVTVVDVSRNFSLQTGLIAISPAAASTASATP